MSNIVIENPPSIDIVIENQAGVPAGGMEGQFLRKLSDSDYHAGWTSGTVSAYLHEQASAQAEWIVNHNLGRYPVVAVLSVGLVEQVADIVHVNTNQVRIYFAEPFAGLAQCI